MTIKTTNLIFRDMFDFINLYGVIYEIRNKINDKKYIGQTTMKLNRRCRWTEDSILSKYINNPYLINSIKKYGINNFERKILDFANNQEELDEKEEYYIQKYNTLDQTKGYNLKHGGSKGKYTQESKDKMSRSQKIYHKNNPNIQTGKNNPMYGKHHRKETKKKIQKKLKGKNSSTYRYDLEYITRDFLIKEYWISEHNMENRILEPNQKSLRTIAKENNCSLIPIIQRIEKFNIIKKNQSETSKLTYIKKQKK